MNFRISGEKLNFVKKAEYLSLTLEEHLNFKKHMDTVMFNLNGANDL